MYLVNDLVTEVATSILKIRFLNWEKLIRALHVATFLSVGWRFLSGHIPPHLSLLFLLVFISLRVSYVKCEKVFFDICVNNNLSGRVDSWCFR